MEDGRIFDKSKEGEPLEFTVGAGELIPGFDQAVEGMKLNDFITSVNIVAYK